MITPRFLERVHVAAIVLFSMPVGAALAAEQAPFSGEITVEFQDDWAAHSEDPAAKGNDAFLTIEAALAARIAEGFSAHADLTFEPVRDRAAGADRFVEEHGLYAESLYLAYATGPFAVRGGKFTQTFAIAWDAAPGIWGTDFAEDYELSEQIGIAADAGFGSATAGRHTVTVGTFFADTTVLSESAFTNRGRTRRADGGAGNTADFSSYALALEGGEIAALPGLGYHLAYASRGTRQPGETRETGFAAALTHAVTIGGIDMAPIVEWVRFNNRDGTPGTDVTYLTTGLGLTWDKWNLALSRTTREKEAAGGSGSDDSLAQISAGYAFDNGIGFNVGYRHSEESGLKTHTYGFLVDYAVAF